MTERTLFDSLDDGAPDGVMNHSDQLELMTTLSGESNRVRNPTDSPWRECPLDEWLAMSERDQLDYCARRDETAAQYAETGEDAAWYTWRAGWYRRRMEEIDV